jgi:hypothetical protein
MRSNVSEGDRSIAKRQRRRDHDETHRLFKDHRLKRRESEAVDQHRQTKFRAA